MLLLELLPSLCSRNTLLFYNHTLVLKSAMRGRGALLLFGLSALGTHIFKWFFVSLLVRQDGVDAREYKLHLEVVCEVLKPLDLSLERLYEIFHVAAIQTLLLYLLRCLRANLHHWRLNHLFFSLFCHLDRGVDRKNGVLVGVILHHLIKFLL